MTRDEMRQASVSTDLTLRTTARRAEHFQMAVASNEMETIIDPVPIVRSAAAGS